MSRLGAFVFGRTLPRPEGLAFGMSPRACVVGGIIAIVCGGVFALVGGAFFLAYATRADAPVNCLVFGSAFLAPGCVVALAGLQYIVRRHEFVVVLTDYAVHVGPGYRRSVAYRDIKRVSRGTDGDVYCHRANSMHGFKIPDYFGSTEEANRFVEELNRRVEQAKNR